MVDKSTLDQIHVIKLVAKRSHEFNNDVYNALSGFLDRIDSVNRGKFWSIMARSGVSGKPVRMAKAFVQESIGKISF